jgi:XTP/dITP diphosphohydrolase
MASADESRRIVVATSNAGKLREIRAILGEAAAGLCSLEGLASVRFPEEGADYRENAVAKAAAVASQLGEIAVADDSGLEVEALGGRPGPMSARYGGPGLGDAGRVQRLLAELGDLPSEQRGARFVCEAALATPEGLVITARGVCSGRVAEAPRGTAGFGYDPIFRVEGGERVMAELAADEKNAISHRALAFRALWRQWVGPPASGATPRAE